MKSYTALVSQFYLYCATVHNAHCLAASGPLQVWLCCKRRLLNTAYKSECDSAWKVKGPFPKERLFQSFLQNCTRFSGALCTLPLPCTSCQKKNKLGPSAHFHSTSLCPSQWAECVYTSTGSWWHNKYLLSDPMAMANLVCLKFLIYILANLNISVGLGKRFFSFGALELFNFFNFSILLWNWKWFCP